MNYRYNVILNCYVHLWIILKKWVWLIFFQMLALLKQCGTKLAVCLRYNCIVHAITIICAVYFYHEPFHPILFSIVIIVYVFISLHFILHLLFYSFFNWYTFFVSFFCVSLYISSFLSLSPHVLIQILAVYIYSF